MESIERGRYREVETIFERRHLVQDAGYFQALGIFHHLHQMLRYVHAENALQLVGSVVYEARNGDRVVSSKGSYPNLISHKRCPRTVRWQAGGSGGDSATFDTSPLLFDVYVLLIRPRGLVSYPLPTSHVPVSSCHRPYFPCSSRSTRISSYRSS